jgi:hypothetical protein
VEFFRKHRRVVKAKKKSAKCVKSSLKAPPSQKMVSPKQQLLFNYIYDCVAREQPIVQDFNLPLKYYNC